MINLFEILREAILLITFQHRPQSREYRQRFGAPHDATLDCSAGKASPSKERTGKW